MLVQDCKSSLSRLLLQLATCGRTLRFSSRLSSLTVDRRKSVVVSSRNNVDDLKTSLDDLKTSVSVVHRVRVIGDVIAGVIAA